ncbi:hypothetical protein PR048_020166 [Dryococelus australis]|uniref:Tesmin/TSO1-like CXC domain-containing protein n=1 Tax=Dryococelus australis TaxID=614101 RepID=A0ABQ9H5I8_9NEOP|nr:hypothetical protein PR048_020166 [Dryococelus australis]
MSLCFICDSSLEDGTSVSNVRSRGIASLIKASTERKDGKGIFLRGKTSLDVHDKCRKAYVKERMITVYVKRVEEQAFKDSNATQEMVAADEERFLVSLYGYRGTNVPSLNYLRYISYKTSAFRYSSNIDALTPSASAARHHCLKPVFTVLSPGPPAMLKIVSCMCTKNCQRNCGCKKAGLCSPNMCLNCEGNCNNIAVMSQDEEDELNLETKQDIDCPPIEFVNPME